MAIRTGWWSSLCLLLISVEYATTQVTTADDGGTCQCEYIEQPPNELQCNPYLMAELRLECTIFIPTSQLSKEIVWFRSHLQTASDTSETVTGSEFDRWLVDRLDSEQPNVQIWQQNLSSSNGRNTWIRSQLRISNLNNSYVGDYLCRVKVGRAEWLIPSDSVYLQQSSSYAHFGPCSSEFAQSKQERKCANWDAMSTPPNMAPTSRTTTSESTSSGAANSNVPSVNTQTDSPTAETNVTSASVVDISTTSIPDELSENVSTNDAGGSGGNVLINEEQGEPESNRALLNELYVSISILILFGVIIFILVPVMLYMLCRKKKKVRTPRRRPDLERVQPAVNTERRSATMPVASDYLIPQPFLGITQDQLEQQAQRLHRSRSLQPRYSYETTLGFSHEYEDVVDLAMVDSGEEKPDTYVNVNQPEMKRNAAYRACSTSEDERGMTRIQLLEGASCQDIVIPNPLNCVHTQSHPGIRRERMSDVSDDQDSLVGTIAHSYEQ